VDSLVGGVEAWRWWTGVADDGEPARREGGRQPTVDSFWATWRHRRGGQGWWPTVDLLGGKEGGGRRWTPVGGVEAQRWWTGMRLRFGRKYASPGAAWAKIFAGW
jgi:hypothetical protein